jgi:aryl-alcohol dehydrogenase-like predicted oxidoreductase
MDELNQLGTWSTQAFSPIPELFTAKSLKIMINRRDFIKNSILGTAGLGIANGEKISGMMAEKKLTIKEYRKLGNTDFRVSDISVGQLTNEGVLRAALEAGINYIDTSELYSSGKHENIIGSVIKDYKRDSLFITSKVFYKPFKSKEDILQRVENSLKRLDTPYIDCLMIHQVEDTEIIKDEFFHQAAAELMDKGKVRHLGIACHGNSFVNPVRDSYEEILMSAINDGRFDMLFFAYNFLEHDVPEKILKLCHEKKIGTLVMKSNPVFAYSGLKQILKEMEERGEEPPKFHLKVFNFFEEKVLKVKEFFEEDKMRDEKEMHAAGTKFVLSNPYVNTVVNSVMNFSDLEAFLELSGHKLETNDLHLLQKYKYTFGFLNCHIGCDKCEAACPRHVPVNNIMRYNYYFQVKHQEKFAMESYAGIEGTNAGVCAVCPGHCMEACPHQVFIQPLLQMAHRNLEIMPGSGYIRLS